MHEYIVTHCFYSYRTALHIACASGHVEVVHFLLERKARLNLCDNQNRSALMKVIQDMLWEGAESVTEYF